MNERTERQQIAHKWALECFGEAHVKNPAQRALRLLEEAVEMAQACGVTQDMAQKCVDVVYSRPVGEPFNEAGGIGLTLLILCETLEFDAEHAEAFELGRVLAKPREEFYKRNAEKVALGLDATALSGTSP